MRKLSSLLSLFLVVCLFVGGASATWIYAAGPISDFFKEIFVSSNFPTKYTVQFINEGEVLFEITKNFNEDVSENELTGYEHEFESGKSFKEQTNPIAALLAQIDELKKQSAEYAEKYKNVGFRYWMNAGSTIVKTIEDNIEYIIKLYPAFTNLFTAMFVDENGDIISMGGNSTAWTNFTADAEGYKKVRDFSAEVPVPPPSTPKANFRYWEVHETNEKGETIAVYPLNIVADANPTTEPDIYNKQMDSSTYGKNGYTDVTIYPVYTYEGAQLIPVDGNGDGSTDHYEVGGFGTEGERELVEIPNTFNGKPVTTVNANAFSSFDHLHSIRVPANVTTINYQAFTADNPNQLGTQRDTVTIYYEGDPVNWLAHMNKLYNNSQYTHQSAYQSSNAGISITKDGNTYGIDHKDVEGTFDGGWDNAMGGGSRVFFLTNGEVDYNKGYWELVEQRYGFLNLQSRFIWTYYSSVPDTMKANYTNPCNNCGTTHNPAGVREDVVYWGEDPNAAAQ